MRNDITIRPETSKDYKDIISLVLRSFKEGTDYSDGSDIIALIEEIRMSEYYIPELSFVAELEGKIVGHFLFSRFPLSQTKEGGHINDGSIVMLAPVSVHADYFHKHIGITMLKLGIEEVKKHGFKGINVEGDYHFYNRVGFKNLSSQAYAHVFSANFAADCVKNPCRATARLRIFALSATKLCSKIRTHFL